MNAPQPIFSFGFVFAVFVMLTLSFPIITHTPLCTQANPHFNDHRHLNSTLQALLQRRWKTSPPPNNDERCAPRLLECFLSSSTSPRSRCVDPQHAPRLVPWSVLYRTDYLHHPAVDQCYQHTDLPQISHHMHHTQKTKPHVTHFWNCSFFFDMMCIINPPHQRLYDN